MKFDRDIQEKVTRFAREQSQFYLEEAEMSYIDQLRRKSRMTVDKAKAKVDKYFGKSKKSQEAEDDLALYMSDYMSDLVSKGMSQEEALERAEGELKFNSENTMTEEIQTKYQQYYESTPLHIYEAIGLIYGAACVFGIVLGGAVGLVLGAAVFTETALWIPTVIGIGAGALLGSAVGMVFHVTTILKYHK